MNRPSPASLCILSLLLGAETAAPSTSAAAAQAAATSPPVTKDGRPVSKRLEIDPSENVAVAGWWWDDQVTMLLAPDHRYQVWAGRDRYRPPIDSGRWSKSNFNTLILDPTNAEPTVLHRVLIRRIDKQLRLELDENRSPMVMGQAPPTVMGDLVLGTWMGELARLELFADGRYEYMQHQRKPSEDQSAIAVGQRGTWIVVGEDLKLIRANNNTVDWVKIILPRPPAASTAPNGDTAKAEDASGTKSAAPLRAPVQLKGLEDTFSRPEPAPRPASPEDKQSDPAASP